jgi:hypothetical protein
MAFAEACSWDTHTVEEWRNYEEQIYEMLVEKASPDAQVEFDVRLPGHQSGTERQVDVHVTGEFAGRVLPGPATLAVDCKCWSRTVNVPDVERFMGLLEDIGADMGLIITTTGFSEAGKRRAARGRGVHIDVVTFQDLARWTPPDLWLCTVCDVDDEMHMPGAVYAERYVNADGRSSERIFVGVCDRCQSVHLLCSCGTLSGIHEAEEGEQLECEGCGRSFVIEPLIYDRDNIATNDSVHERVHLR